MTADSSHGGPEASTVAPGGVVFEILSGYNPLPDRRVKDVAEKNKAEGSGVVPDGGSRGRTRHHETQPQGKAATRGTLKGGAR